MIGVITKEKNKTQSSSKDDAYLDRNHAVLALAKLAMQQGYTVGVSDDPEEPEYSVLTIDLPTGQVSWHLPEKDFSKELKNLPDYPKDWDGHDLQEKRTRMKLFIESNRL